MVKIVKHRPKFAYLLGVHTVNRTLNFLLAMS